MIFQEPAQDITGGPLWQSLDLKTTGKHSPIFTEINYQGSPAISCVMRSKTTSTRLDALVAYFIWAKMALVLNNLQPFLIRRPVHH